MEGKKFYNEINLMRGLAIMFVVLYHSVPTDDFPIWDNLTLFMDNCVMLLYFMISGFVNSRKFCLGQNCIKNVLKQARNILVPYVIYSVCTYILKLITNTNDGTGLLGILSGNSPCPILWFLWVLFIITAVTFGIGFLLEKMKLKNREEIFLVLAFVAYFLNKFVDFGIFQLCIGYLPYFYIGIFLRKYYDAYQKLITNKIVCSCMFVIFAVLFIFGIDTYVVYQFTAISSVWFLFLTLTCKYSDSAIYRFFDSFGKHSFEVYLWSYFVQVASRVVVVGILGIDGIAGFVILFALGLFVPLAAAVFAKKFNLVLR